MKKPHREEHYYLLFSAQVYFMNFLSCCWIEWVNLTVLCSRLITHECSWHCLLVVLCVYVYSFVVLSQCRYSSGINSHYHRNMHILALQNIPLKPVFQKNKEECYWGKKSNKGGKIVRLKLYKSMQLKSTLLYNSLQNWC